MEDITFFYLLGAAFAFVMMMNNCYTENRTFARKGKLYLSDVAFSVFSALLSWLTVFIIILLYFHDEDNDHIIIH